MTKTSLAVFCVFSLLVLALIGSAAAYNAAFTHTLYQGDAAPTVDGTYAPGAEWAASGVQAFGTNGFFRDYWVMEPNLLCLLI